MLRPQIDVSEQVFAHESVVALGMIRRQSDVLVHIESHHVGERQLPRSVEADQLVVGAFRRGAVGSPSTNGASDSRCLRRIRSAIWRAVQREASSAVSWIISLIFGAV